jgi:hypothetical protein
MKIIVAVLAVGVISTSWSVTGSAQPSSQPSQVWVLHGANLDGQEEPTAGGSQVTLCQGSELLGVGEFGTLLARIDSTGGAVLDLTVRAGEADCATPGVDEPLGSATVTADASGTVVVVTPDGEGGVDLPAFGVPAACTEFDEGRLVAVHAAPGSPPVQVNTAAAPIGLLAYGEAAGVEIPAGRPGSTEGEVLVDDVAVLGPLSVPVGAGSAGLIAVAGNPEGDEPTPLVALVGPLEVGLCARSGPLIVDVEPDPPAPAPAPAPAGLSLTG